MLGKLPYHIHKPKDNKLAKQYRENGNELFAKSNFFDALEFYNKSLCFAEYGSEDMALAYGNRSAVYLEIKEFDKCLENIKLARDSRFPCNKLYRLSERESRCNKLKRQHQPNEDEDPWNFFKLSYPPRKNYPAIVDCLELRENQKFGRYIITTRDLNPGDIIAIEETAFNDLESDGSFSHCASCFKHNKMSLIPHLECANAMFCSQECFTYGWYKHMCATDDMLTRIRRFTFEAIDAVGGDLNKLESLVSDRRLHSKTVFDVDLRNPSDPNFKYNQFVAFNSLATYKNSFPFSAKDLQNNPILMGRWTSTRDKAIVAKYMIHAAHRFHNEFGYDVVQFSKAKDGSPYPTAENPSKATRIGQSIFLFISFLNHSCIPNINLTKIDNKLVASVSLPIKKGEQLFITYGKSFFHPIEVRQKFLIESFSFKCACVACKHNWSRQTIRRADLSLFIHPENKITYTSIKATKEEYKRNCEYIQKNFHNFPCLEILTLNVNNKILLEVIAKTEKFLFTKL